MAETEQPNSEPERIPFRLHPRVFSALGSELITNDVVAIIELVKNSYDALSPDVNVRFKKIEDTEEMCIEIEDYGTGMSRSVIENAWCVVATPYRMQHPISQQGERTRRVSGEKGLGRLSAARLGERMELITQTGNGQCWQVNVTWADLAGAESLNECNVELRKCTGKNRLGHTGTLVRILDLNSEWDELRIQDLREQLSRLVSPFANIGDFKIHLYLPGEEEGKAVEIKPAKFLSKPPYLIKGHVDESGFVKCTYRYSTPQGRRSNSIQEQLWASEEGSEQPGSAEDGQGEEAPSCGPFDFEIRAWDIDKESVQEIAQRFDISKSTIRKDIRNYRGISLYRDGILVLPKSDLARDWLGLDLRRVSKVGTRVSTSQIVGYVAITAEDNEEIKDTSDRERLEDNPASRDFIKILLGIVRILENERSRDREETTKEPPFRDLFSALSPRGLVENVSQFALRGGQASEVLPLVEEYGAQVEDTINKIERRLVYYSRLASIGVLAAMIVHEVRNQTMTIGGLTRAMRKLFDKNGHLANEIKEIEDDLSLAEAGVRSLDRLADRFAPLASKTLRTRRRDSVIEEIIRDCVGMREQEINGKGVEVNFNSSSKTVVAVDPGELTAVIINLLDNSLYWLSYVKDRPRRIEFRVSLRPKTSRVYVQVHDSGPGVPKGYEERIFWPGVTRKAEGLGMGLTVASEIVAEYGGGMHLIEPGILEGASFGFDLPMSERSK